jgi:hypothetical protein
MHHHPLVNSLYNKALLIGLYASTAYWYKHRCVNDFQHTCALFPANKGTLEFARHNCLEQEIYRGLASQGRRISPLLVQQQRIP